VLLKITSDKKQKLLVQECFKAVSRTEYAVCIDLVQILEKNNIRKKLLLLI